MTRGGLRFYVRFSKKRPLVTFNYPSSSSTISMRRMRAASALLLEFEQQPRASAHAMPDTAQHAQTSRGWVRPRVWKG